MFFSTLPVVRLFCMEVLPRSAMRAEMNTNDHFHVKLYNSYRVKGYPTEIASLFS